MKPQYREISNPTDNQLLNQFLAIRDEKQYGRIFSWVEEFERRKDPRERMNQLLARLLDAAYTLESIKITSICLMLKGNRKDIRILEKCLFFKMKIRFLN